jgi:hypothetical protein
VGYDPDTQTLEVEFHKGGIYQYYGVPSLMYEGVITASSVGKFFNANIKSVFSYEKVG